MKLICGFDGLCSNVSFSVFFEFFGDGVLDCVFGDDVFFKFCNLFWNLFGDGNWFLFFGLGRLGIFRWFLFLVFYVEDVC